MGTMATTDAATVACTAMECDLLRSSTANSTANLLTSSFARSVLRLLPREEDDGYSASTSAEHDGNVLMGVILNEPSAELFSLGIALLNAFVQINWTGPALPLTADQLFPSSAATTTTTPQQLNDAALLSLAYCGEPVYHLTHAAPFLYLALQILGILPSPCRRESSIVTATTNSATEALRAGAGAKPDAAGGPYGLDWSAAGWHSIAIWRLRAGLIWLRILDGPVPLPAYIAANALSLRSALDPATHSQQRAQLSLSLSLLASLLARSSSLSSAQKEASNLAVEAAEEVGLQWMLTGRLGKKTKWQRDDKTQLVVLARDAVTLLDGNDNDKDNDSKDADKVKAKTELKGIVPEGFDLNDDTILEKTEFTATAVASSTTAAAETTAATTVAAIAAASLLPLDTLDPTDQPSLSPFSQSILLSLSLSTLSQPTSLINLHTDILSTAQVSAFVARVLVDPKNWSVHSMALLLRCRAEAGRSRTVERGVLQMQALVDQLRDGNPHQISALSSAVKEEDRAPAEDRLAFFHALALPPEWQLEKELATRYLSLGVSKSALEIFTRLEMWEEVARCWVSLDRPEKGIAVIRDLLGGTRAESDLVMGERKRPSTAAVGGGSSSSFRGGEKREAKLWCTLGELENDPAHYETAWTVSRHTSSRAQRALGAVHWAAERWTAARTSLRLALAINPLFARTWFVLGCCEMRLQDWPGAQEAFGRCVALEDEDGESWSNLASCHLRRGESEGDSKKEGRKRLNDDDTDDDDEEDEGAIDSTAVQGSTSTPTMIDDEADAIQQLPFSRKRAAFHCLRQAIKHSYESWRVWMNYMVVAVDVGEMSEACRALARLVEMRASKDGEAAVDLDVLERLVDAVTRASEEEDDFNKSDSNGAGESSFGSNPNGGKGLAKRVELLITRDILPRISNSPRVFLAHARLCLYSSDYAGALDAHLKAYRSGIVIDSTLEHDRSKFREAALRVEEIVGMLENLGPKEKKDGELVAKDWKYQAKSIVRSFMGRTKSAFEDEPEFERLKVLAAELK